VILESLYSRKAILHTVISLTSIPFFTGAGLDFSLMTSASEMAMILFRDCKISSFHKNRILDYP